MVSLTGNAHTTTKSTMRAGPRDSREFAGPLSPRVEIGP
jgi:hypothetical protein